MAKKTNLPISGEWSVKAKNINLPSEIDFDKLISLKGNLYLPKNVSPNTFQLGSILFEVVEDQSDGYRSSMQEVKIVSDNNLTRDNRLLAEIEIKSHDSGGRNTYLLVDTKDGHVWCEFGTDNLDNYYPNFVFNWTPKPDPIISHIANLIKK